MLWLLCTGPRRRAPALSLGLGACRLLGQELALIAWGTLSHQSTALNLGAFLYKELLCIQLGWPLRHRAQGKVSSLYAGAAAVGGQFLSPSGCWRLSGVGRVGPTRHSGDFGPLPERTQRLPLTKTWLPMIWKHKTWLPIGKRIILWPDYWKASEFSAKRSRNRATC